MTRVVRASTRPIAHTADDPATADLVEIFNTMLQAAQRALEAYNGLRATLHEALGDQSSLLQLEDRMGSLSSHCLAGLVDGITAVRTAT